MTKIPKTFTKKNRQYWVSELHSIFGDASDVTAATWADELATALLLPKNKKKKDYLVKSFNAIYEAKCSPYSEQFKNLCNKNIEIANILCEELVINAKVKK